VRVGVEGHDDGADPVPGSRTLDVKAMDTVATQPDSPAHRENADAGVAPSDRAAGPIPYWAATVTVTRFIRRLSIRGTASRSTTPG